MQREARVERDGSLQRAIKAAEKKQKKEPDSPWDFGNDGRPDGR